MALIWFFALVPQLCGWSRPQLGSGNDVEASAGASGAAAAAALARGLAFLRDLNIHVERLFPCVPVVYVELSVVPISPVGIFLFSVWMPVELSLLGLSVLCGILVDTLQSLLKLIDGSVRGFSMPTRAPMTSRGQWVLRRPGRVILREELTVLRGSHCPGAAAA